MNVIYTSTKNNLTLGRWTWPEVGSTISIDMDRVTDLEKANLKQAFETGQLDTDSPFFAEGSSDKAISTSSGSSEFLGLTNAELTAQGLAKESGGNLQAILNKLNAGIGVTASDLAKESGGNLQAILNKLNTGIGVTASDLAKESGGNLQAILNKLNAGIKVSSSTEALPTSGVVIQAIPDLEDASSIASSWGNFSGVDWAGGDFITAVQGTNGQYIVALSGNPLTTGESYVVNTTKAVQAPCDMEFAGSFVRTGISFATASLFSNDPVTGLPDPVPAPINIVSWYQSSAVSGASNTGSAGTSMTILLENALPAGGANNAVFIGDWINITGLIDTRFNYPNACINYISPDRKTITIGYSDEAVLPSLVTPATAGQVNTPVLGTAKVNFYNNMSGARDGIGLRFSGATATSAAVTSIFGGDDNQISGALLGDHRATIATSAPVYLATGLWGNTEIRASSRYLIEAGPKAALVMDKAEQTLTSWTVRDIPRTSVKPSSNALMYPRFRLYRPVSMTRPVAKIISASHAAANSSTVVTMDIPPSAAGLSVGSYVTLRGIRDQGNFAVSATGVAITAINEGANQITVPWGSATIATSYGGSVILQNGGKDQPGIITQVIQSATTRSAYGDNWLDLVGTTSWSGLNIGDYINLHGVRDASSGADVGVDGVWEVAHISTTTMVVKPVYSISGARISPVLGTIAVNCGGTVLLRPTLRSHDLDVNAWSVQRVQIDGQGTMRTDKTLPIVFPVTPSVNAIQSTAAAVGTNGTGAWLVRGAATRIADLVSVAITSTSTGTAIDVSANNGGQQFTFDVTAVSGTSPRMYPRVQESFDGGTNWVTTFDLPPCVNSTDKFFVTPPLPVLGTHVRYIRTLTGTSPSFTNSVIRTTRPTENPPNRRQLVDRVVSLTATTPSTDYLYVEGCRNGQIVISLGAATTSPALKLQVCDDIQANAWYDVAGATVTGAASSTVASSIFNLPPSKFARLVPTSAGSGITADTYTLMLKTWE